MSKIKGGDLMVFINGKSIAFATNHTLTIQGDTQDTSNKDEGGGIWASNEVSNLSWTAQSENLYSEDGAGDNYADLFDLMTNQTVVTLVFARKKEAGNNVPTTGWTANTPTYTGKAVITNLETNAQNGQYATFTVQFTGVGALTKSSATVPQK